MEPDIWLLPEHSSGVAINSLLQPTAKTRCKKPVDSTE
jgi:hypothetical protein